MIRKSLLLLSLLILCSQLAEAVPHPGDLVGTWQFRILFIAYTDGSQPLLIPIRNDFKTAVLESGGLATITFRHPGFEDDGAVIRLRWSLGSDDGVFSWTSDFMIHFYIGSKEAAFAEVSPATQLCSLTLLDGFPYATLQTSEGGIIVRLSNAGGLSP